MKIFSSFDTRYKAKIIQEKEKRFGKENVICITRSTLFAVSKVRRPTLVSLLLGALVYYATSYGLELKTSRSIRSGIITTLIILLLYKVIDHYIDYSMDYCLVCPDQVIFGEQTGIFRRSFVTVDASQLKSITTARGGFVESVFNNGSIIFTFMDTTRGIGHGKVEIDYVFSPENKKRIIDQVITPSNTLLNESNHD